MDDLIRRLQERIQYCPAVEFDVHCGRANESLEPIPPFPTRHRELGLTKWLDQP